MNVYWRGEPVPDVRAFCRAKGFRVAIMKSRERHLNPFSGTWTPGAEWETFEFPEPGAHCLLQPDYASRQVEQEVLRVEAA